MFLHQALYLFALAAVAARFALSSEDWDAYKALHGKSYGSPLEDSLRKAIYAQNKAKIELFNENEAHKVGFTMKLNHLSDLTVDELAKLNGFKSSGGAFKNTLKGEEFLRNILEAAVDIPDEVDWRKVEGIVSGVKDQGLCGSCWSFASAGVLEGQLKKMNLTSVELSVQDLVDCSASNYGCEGGDVLLALKDISKKGGIEADKDYPYKARDGKCKFLKSKAFTSDKGGHVLPLGDEEELKKVVATFGPVAVAINVDFGTFINYKDGVYFSKLCRSGAQYLDHAVLVVGYGKLNGQDYWLVKNSWGESYGDSGYIRMSRNRENNCGIASEAIIPVF